MKFLDTSEETQRAAAAAEEAARQQKLRRMRRIAGGFGVATAVLLAGIAGIGGYYLGYVREHVAYYKDYITAWGIPQGTEPLTEAEIAHRNGSVKITTRGLRGHALSMERLNSAGHLAIKGSSAWSSAAAEEPADKPSRWEYAYDPDGNIAYEVALDGHRQQISRTIYEPANSNSKPIRSRKAYVINRNGSLAPEERSCAAQMGYDYSSEGYLEQTHYYDQQNNPTPGKDGAFITKIQHDGFGRITESTSLGRDGRPMNDMDGKAIERNSYNKNGNLVRREFFDADGKPTDAGNRNGNIFRSAYKYDNGGKLSEEYFQSANGQPDFCELIKVNTDERGNVIEKHCIRQNDNLSKSSIRIMRQTFDPEDQLLEQSYFDGGGNPVLGPAGAFRVKLIYDADGNVKEWDFYGTDDRPIINNLGYYKELSRFEGGHRSRTEYRDTDDRRAALVNGGYAAVSYEYDPHGNNTATTYLSVDNNPVLNRMESYGYAKQTVSFDPCGRPTEIEFFDPDMHPLRLKKGYADIRLGYGENNNVTDEYYLDGKNQFAPSIDGYTHVNKKYDRNGNVIDQQYFDAQGKPFLVKETYAEYKSSYDNHNDLVEEEYLGSIGQLVVNEQGWAKHIKRYNDHNSLIEEAWFGPDGKPVVTKNGYAILGRHYNDSGQLIEESYFGTDGEPVLSEDGYARIVHGYDALGREIEWAYFGIRGEKIIATSDKVINTKEHYHRAAVKLDERGNVLDFIAFGLNDKPLLLGGGYSRTAMSYEAHNHQVTDAYFGENDEPVVSDEGYSSATWGYDRRGNETEGAYFGSDGKPMIGKNGYAKYTKRYNAYDDPVEEDYFGTDGEPVAGNKGYARVTRIYDRAGRKIEEAYFGTDRKPIRQKNGYATVKYGYDDLGREIERSYYGIQGEPVIGKDDNAYYRATRELDPRGNPLEFATFGLDGEPAEVVDPDSGRRCARLVKRFDANDKQINSQCFDAAGMPVLKQ